MSAASRVCWAASASLGTSEAWRFMSLDKRKDAMARTWPLGAPVASQIRDLQNDGRAVAFYGAYHGDFDFVGRLKDPLPVLEDRRATALWLVTHPTGIIVTYFTGNLLHLPGRPIFLGLVGDGWAALWPAKTVLATDYAALDPRF